jgi:hypothetical protein
MLHELVTDPGDYSGAELYDALVTELAGRVEATGVDTVVAETDLDAETVAALAAGNAPQLTLEEAAAVLAAVEDDSPADVLALTRDAVMMGMSQAVLDVEALAAEAGGDLEPREVQSKIEGRFPMTLEEFALLYATIRARVR